MDWRMSSARSDSPTAHRVRASSADSPPVTHGLGATQRTPRPGTTKRSQSASIRSFASAPVSELLPAADVDALGPRVLSLEVNGQLRQRSTLDQLIWDVPEILHELSKLYALRAGDLVFMGTPAGVAALRPGDACVARLDQLLELHCQLGASVA